MSRQTLPITEADEAVRIKRVGGSVKVQGWEGQQLEASGDLVELGREESTVAISCAGDLELMVPRGIALKIDFIGRDLDMQALTGPVEIAFVGSNLVLRDLDGQVTFRGFVGGTTRLENVSRVATAPGGPGPFGAAGAAAWDKIGKSMGRADEARRKLEKKVQKAERKLNRVRVVLDREGARWTWRQGSRSVQGADANPPVSDEERATILRMLQEKKITAEEADRLLGALEGES